MHLGTPLSVLLGLRTRGALRALGALILFFTTFDYPLGRVGGWGWWWGSLLSFEDCASGRILPSFVFLCPPFSFAVDELIPSPLGLGLLVN